MIFKGGPSFRPVTNYLMVMILMLAPLSKTKARTEMCPQDWFGTGLVSLLTLLGKALATIAFSRHKLDKGEVTVGKIGPATIDPKTKVSL